MAFGDSGNDLEMINSVGCGVAVKNADNQIKKVADIVLNETNNQDAVLDSIKKNLIANGAPSSYFNFN